MMELKDQVCTIDQGKTLKELGVRQDTAFSWLSNYDFPVLNGKESPHFVCAAYTASELGIMIGEGIFALANTGMDDWYICEIDGGEPDSIYNTVMPGGPFNGYRTEARAKAEYLAYAMTATQPIGEYYLPGNINARLGGCNME